MSLSEASSNTFAIVPFQEYYPSTDSLDSAQKACYEKIKRCLDQGRYVDVGSNISYLFLYIYSNLDQILKSGKGVIDRVVLNLNKIKNLYRENLKITVGLEYWIGDLYYLKGDLESALKTYEEALLPGQAATHPANQVLNLKYFLKKDVRARELLATNKKLTKFTADKLPHVEKYCNFILEKEKELRGSDFLQYLGKKYPKEKHYPTQLFSGYVGGFDLTELLSPKHKLETFCFYAIPEFYDFCAKLSRDAENLLRDEMGIPQVGKGWISETELYYKIKGYLKSKTVVHHHTDRWLGRQHLDIYIPDLKIAFEYQGKQHFEPVEYFGGEEAFLATQKRDRTKKMKCTRNQVILYPVKDGYAFEDIQKIIDSHITLNKLSEK